MFTREEKMKAVEIIQKELKFNFIKYKGENGEIVQFGRQRDWEDKGEVENLDKAFTEEVDGVVLEVGKGYYRHTHETDGFGAHNMFISDVVQNDIVLDAMATIMENESLLNRKFRFLANTGKTVSESYWITRIVAIRDFGDVKAGDIGGFVDSAFCVGFKDNSWVYDDAIVYSGATVRDNAKIKDTAIVGDKAKIYEDAQVLGDSKVFRIKDIHGKARINIKQHYFLDSVCDLSEDKEYTTIDETRE